MFKGLQTGFGYPIGRELLAELRSFGLDGCRIDCSGLGWQVAAQLTTEVIEAGLKPLVLIDNVNDVFESPGNVDFELGSEPDLNGPAPPAYLSKLRVIENQLARTSSGSRLWAGCISNLNERGLTYLYELNPRSWAPATCVSVHRYPTGDGPTVPHDNFLTRDHEVTSMKAIIGPRPWGVSEFGYHTGWRLTRLFGFIPWPTRWTDQEVRDYTQFEWNFWKNAGATYAVMYQINDGPTNAREDQYGARYLNGTWKPVIQTFPKN